MWASLLIHAGEPGAGTRMKLARNMLIFMSFYAAAVEAQRLAEACGLRPVALGRWCGTATHSPAARERSCSATPLVRRWSRLTQRPLLEHTRTWVRKT